MVIVYFKDNPVLNRPYKDFREMQITHHSFWNCSQEIPWSSFFSLYQHTLRLIN